jgi:hypothetical protein
MAILETLPIGADERHAAPVDSAQRVEFDAARGQKPIRCRAATQRVEITRARQSAASLLDRRLQASTRSRSPIFRHISFISRNGIKCARDRPQCARNAEDYGSRYIVYDGVVFHSGAPASLAANDQVKRIYLGGF